MSILLSTREGRQLCLFENLEIATRLSERLGSYDCERLESSLQNLSPYEHRLKPSTVQALIELYSRPGDVVLDPFAGSGTVPLEAVLAERFAWANDLNPYAYRVTQGKLSAPSSERIAIQQVKAAMAAIAPMISKIDLDSVPAWVQDFFHPDTLREIVAAFQHLRQQPNDFLLACLLGILHHVLPSYLSYPSNQQAPYLRRGTYPPEQFPHLYTYRDLRSRLIAKVRRTYRHPCLPDCWQQRQYQVWQTNSMHLPITDASVDAVISRPPHPGAFEYARDQRLRLWFLGCENWKALHRNLISSPQVFFEQMFTCLQELARVLKPQAYCVLVVGEVQQHGKNQGIAEALAELVGQATDNQLRIETIYDDLPEGQRSRSNLKPVKFDRILVMRKQ